jgi:hypothetical protein
MLYRVDLDWAGFELTTLMVIHTDCIDSCKSNYHTITTTTVPSVQRTLLTRHNNKSKKSAWCSRLVLKQKAQLDFFSARSLKTSHLIDISLYSNANISWFWAKKYFMLLFITACLLENSQIPISLYLVWPDLCMQFNDGLESDLIIYFVWSIVYCQSYNFFSFKPYIVVPESWNYNTPVFLFHYLLWDVSYQCPYEARRGRMVVEFITTYAISDYYH